MLYPDNQFISARDLSFKGVLHDIKKSKTALQPIFEAFTNAIEAIKSKSFSDKNYKGLIEIKINATENSIQSHDFTSLTISDNGIGFTDLEFTRFNTFKDSSKGFKNIGSGRIQFVHFFDNTKYISVFKKDDLFYEREFIVSKKKNFLDSNSIVLHQSCKPSQLTETGTTVSFNSLLENSNIYNKLDESELKDQLLKRYVHYFCHNKADLPQIEIKFYVQSKLKGETTIDPSEVPDIDKYVITNLPYIRISPNGKSIEKVDKTEEFRIDAFRIKDNVLEFNDLKLISKGEIVEESGVRLENLSKVDHVEGYKYLFLVSSNYIDSRDTDMRGELTIPTLDSYIKSPSLFTTEEIVIDDIQNEVNAQIDKMYPEIEEVKQKHNVQFNELKEMFLLDDETAKELNISINDNEFKILEKFYEAEAKKSACLDASIKESVDHLDKLDTTAPNYLEELKKEVDKLVKAIPLQNKKSLTHYVARRKLVLDLLDKVLHKKLDAQNSGREYDEELIHDLLFQQGSNNPENSDLWIINEEFIYFKGNSNIPLNKIEINSEKLFKDSFTDAEEKYLRSLGENRKIKKPDILLFPDEGKCIIIEFKAPDVNASDHLTQIDKYAGLIRNYSEDKFQITTFYGYLLGENIEPRDVLGAVSSFEESYQFDYLFRPSTKVIGFDGRSHGSIYTEVIKYSTLVLRARLRNRIFIEKLQ